MVCADGTTRPNLSEPCLWDADTSCDTCWDDYPEEVKTRSIRMASSLLWRLTGRQFGCCCITVRPCGDSCVDSYSTYTGWSGVGLVGTGGGQDILRPAILDGRWVNCGCAYQCCGAECTVDLPVGPVCEVSEVLVDGDVWPLGMFSVMNGRTLVRNNIGTDMRPFEVFRTWQQNGMDMLGTGTVGGVEGGQVTITAASGNVNNDPVLTKAIPHTVTVPAKQNVVRLRIGTSASEYVELAGGRWLDQGNAVIDGQRAYGNGVDATVKAYAVVEDGSAVFTPQGQPVGVVIESVSWWYDDCFPECNDFGKDVTEDGTWSVSYSWGLPLPADGEYIVGKLASEFAKACVGDQACQLPRRVQTLTREGVSATFVEDGNFLAEGLVGILEIDQWIRSVNPYGLRQRSRVFNPQTYKNSPRETWKPS